MQSLTTINDSQALAPVEPPPPPESFYSHVPNYALLFFDHLYSEYLTLKSKIEDKAVVELFESLRDKRMSNELSWSDIYTFDLALVDQRPLENLIRKAYDARAKYRSIAGQKEYDEYLASKPPDLTTILIAPTNGKAAPAPQAAPAPRLAKRAPCLAKPAPQPAPPADPDHMPESAEIIQRVLRADIRYLLGKFYLYYAMLPMRENLREHLTSRAVRMTKWILGTIVVLMVLSFGGGLILKHFSTRYGDILGTFGELLGAFGPIVGSVAFAGIVGGCVSMLQRIQSAPSEGDALFNLAALTNGWRGLSLSPLYGGIFASLLFILFAAGILQGSIFPEIETLKRPAAAAEVAAQNPATPAGDSTATTPSTANDNLDLKSSPNVSASENQVLKIKDFLKETGPRDGVSFALLMIWSFIAGFAERLVPDTLNRLVAKTEAIQGTNG
jgi:hypothetical protein